jgi:hypothetical protein
MTPLPHAIKLLPPQGCPILQVIDLLRRYQHLRQRDHWLTDECSWPRAGARLFIEFHFSRTYSISPYEARGVALSSA